MIRIFKIFSNLSINTNHSFLRNTEDRNDPIGKAITKYKNHPSIISIKKFVENSDSSFSFQLGPKDKITKTMKMLDPKKVVQSTDILTKVIKSFSDFFSDYIYMYILILISASKTESMLKTLKKAKVRSLYKNDGWKRKM